MSENRSWCVFITLTDIWSRVKGWIGGKSPDIKIKQCDKWENMTLYSASNLNECPGACTADKNQSNSDQRPSTVVKPAKYSVFGKIKRGIKQYMYEDSTKSP